MRRFLTGALVALAFAFMPTLAAAQGLPAAGQLYAGPTSGPASAPSFRALTLTDLPAGITVGTAFAEMKPFSGQGSGAWNVTDPFGNAISTTGTTCQGFDKLVAAAATNGWSWRVVGNATISCTAPIALPTCFGKSEFIDNGVTLAFTAQGASNLVTMNSHENCDTHLMGPITQNAADTGTVLALAPTTNNSNGNTVFAASRIEIQSVAPGTAGIGVKLDPTSGGFIGNVITIHDVNGGATGIQVLNPGSGVIAFEQNKFFGTYNHGQTTRVWQIGTGTTNQANMRYNTWSLGRVDPGSGATVAVDTWARNDTFVGLTIDNETANATTGLKLESGANSNIFLGGIVQATSALSDSGTGNLYCNLGSVADNCTLAATTGTLAAGRLPPVALSNMANLAAKTFIGNNTGSSATPIALTIPQSQAALAIQFNPGGRLTFTSGSPVMTSTVATATSVFYAPYVNPYIPLYDGTQFGIYQFTSSASDTVGLTLTLGSNWAATTLYDVFITLSGGVPVICTGPAWSSASARSAAGSIGIFNGMLVNSNASAMTCRTTNAATISVTQNQATYVGTFLTTGSTGTVSYAFGGSASGGTAGFLGLCNYYNRVKMSTQVTDSGAANYAYTSATIRQARASAGNQVTMVQCVAEDTMTADLDAASQTTGVANSSSRIGLGLDSTSTFANGFSRCLAIGNAAVQCAMHKTFSSVLAIGSHVISSNEEGDGSTANGFDSDSNNTLTLTLLN